MYLKEEFWVQILYDIYTKDIITDKKNEVDILQFADDIVIYNTGKGDLQIGQLETEIARIDKELIELGLNLEPKKTNVIKFEEYYRGREISQK